MSGISRFEKGILLLTAGFVLFTVGWFLAKQNPSEPYTVTVGTSDPEAPVPTPAQEETAANGERPDSLLPDEVIDLNTADIYDLDRLPGIGPSKAEAILAYREEHGPFQSVEDLLAVSGIGEVTLENLRPYITAGSTSTTAEN